MEHAAKPVFKRLFYVRRSLADSSLRIAETVPGRAVEVEDEDGAAAKLIKLMDGTRTVDQIWDSMQQEGHDLSKAELFEIIEQFDRLGYLDDARFAEHTSLSAEERNRFQANINYFSYYSTMSSSPLRMQEQLKHIHITIIGLGTLGSGVLFNLACLGAASVRIIDFDVVERSNLNRQMLYNEHDIGRRKVDAAADFLSRFYPIMKVEPVDLHITSAADAKDVIAGSDFVVLAADQPHIELERWVNQACMELGVPWIGGGVNLVEGMLFTVIPGQTGCIECNHLIQNGADESRSSFVRDFMSSGFRMPSAAIAAHYMMLIGAVASEIARFVTGFAPLQSAGKVIAIDFHTYTSEVRMDYSKPVKECPVCFP